MLRTLLALLFFVPMLAIGQTSNPLLIYSNAPIHFEQVDVAVVKDAVAEVIKRCDAQVKVISNIPAGKQTEANTLLAFDELNYELTGLGGKLSVVSTAFDDEATRMAAIDANKKLSAYASDLYLNVRLYNALKRYSSSGQARSLKPDGQKFMRETIAAFQNNGMHLTAAGRVALKRTVDKVLSYSSQFIKNLVDYADTISFSGKQLTGVPTVISAPWRKGDRYLVPVNAGNFINVLRFADEADVRKAMLVKYYNRAYPANMKALDSLFYYRQQLATRLGFKTYAQYALTQKMADKPADVWLFLNDLQAKLSPKIPIENAELRGLKKFYHPEATDSLFAWDGAYYGKKLLDVKYQFSTDEVRQYFEMDNTIAGMFSLYQELFGITIREVAGMPAWHHKVRGYELFKDGAKMGTFYLDLYPREGKLAQFATYNLSLYHKSSKSQELLPVSTLICNLPEAKADQPTLLNHGDVVTLFHEFGHLMHFLLAHPAIASQNAFAVKGDFIEAPSQFLENFCWQYDALKLFAKHYKTGAVLPQALFDKMDKARIVGLVTANMYQVYLATIDFTYHDRYAIARKQGINNVSAQYYKILQMPFPTGTHNICSFDHLNSYGANYYGYLWSKVYAQDIFSIFQQKGIVNPEVGIRYRKLILEKGATVDERTMLQNFLGRKPSSKAFLKGIGL